MITVLYVRGRYLNPSYSALFDTFEEFRSGSLRVIDVSTASLAEIKAAVSASDALAVSEMVVALSLPWANRFSGWAPVTERPRAFYEDVVAALIAAAAPMMMVSFSWDLHVHGDAFPIDPRIREWTARCAALAWMWEREPTPLEAVPEPYRDAWMAAGGDPLRTWERVRAAFPVRVDLPFSLRGAEFRDAAPRDRWDVTVAGVAYATRRVAIDSIQTEALSLAPYRPIALTNTVIDRIAHRVPSRMASALWRGRLRFAQAAQRWIVASAPVNFVCGSGYRYPVRKFFEIPAARSAMVAYPCNGFEDFGFVDGENAIEALPEDAGAAIRKLRGHPNVAERIAAAGWATVRRLHSADQRVRDVLGVMTRLAAGTLRGARFVDGVFEIY